MTSAFVTGFRAMKARAYVRIVGANREISWVATEILLPMLAVTAYILLYRSLGMPKMMEGIIITGAAMIPMWLVVLWAMAMQFYWEKEMGNLDIYLSSPAHPIALLLGMAIGGLFMGGLRSILIIILGIVLFKVEMNVTNWPAFTAIAVVTLAALFAMGMAAASVYFVTGRKGIKINIVLMEPVFMLTGTYFPLKNLGFVISVVASLLPISIGLDALRQLCVPGYPLMSFLTWRIELAALCVMFVVFSFASVQFLARMEAKGRRDGTLSEKWQ
ncbi:ABC transporter permease [bacterium]|nr:ABC transporter permease [bacterium]